MKNAPLPIKILLLIAVIVGGYFGLYEGELTRNVTVLPGIQAEPSRTAAPRVDGQALIEQAFSQRLSDLQVRVDGRVAKLLPDDRDGSRHQRFILKLESGHTVLVAHNIDLAPRVDGLAVGDSVALFGEYEWNERGGVIHWTHHDPRGAHEGGWIRYRGRLYQ